MPDEAGAFTATLCAFDSSGTQLGCTSISGNGTDTPAHFIGVYDDTQEISKVTMDAGGALYPHDFAVGDALVVNGEKQLAAVPASVTVPQGATSATFPITTNEVSTSTSLTISGNDNTTQTATLTLTPPVLLSILMNANTVPGGTSSTGTVTLASPAPSGGALVVLTNDVPGRPTTYHPGGNLSGRPASQRLGSVRPICKPTAPSTGRPWGRLITRIFPPARCYRCPACRG